MSETKKTPFYKRWWFFLIVIIIILGAIGNNKDNESQVSTSQSEKASEPIVTKDDPNVSAFSAGTNHRYKLSKRQFVILDSMLRDERENMAEGSLTILSQHLGMLSTTGRQLDSEYKANEAAADKKFKGKHLLVTAKVDSINKGLGGNPYFVIAGGFPGGQAHFDDSYLDYASSIKKGDNVRLVCVGNGYIIASAMLKDCEPASSFAQKEADKLMRRISRILGGTGSDKTVQLFLSTAIAADSLMPETECLEVGQKCVKSLGSTLSKEGSKESIAKALEQLKTAGVSIAS